jgi:hypothetical protein
MARLGTPLAQDLGLGGQVGRVSWIGRRGGLVHLGLAPAHQGLLAGLGIGLQFGEHGGFEGERLGAAQLALGQVGVDLRRSDGPVPGFRAVVLAVQRVLEALPPSLEAPMR